MMRNARLAMKILVGTAGIIIALGLAMIFFVRHSVQAVLYDKLERRGVSITKHIARAGTGPLVTERFHELELLARDYMQTEDDIEYILFMNQGGDVVAHTFENGYPDDLERVKLTAAGTNPSVKRLEIDRRAILDVTVPLMNGSAGTVHLGIAEASVKKDVDDIIKMIVWIIIIVLAAGIGLAAALSAALTRHVKELVNAAQAVERGDLSARVRVDANDEIGILGRAFNSMIGARRKAEEELRRSEKKLRDITSSLGEGVLVINAVGELEFMNPEAEQLLGWTEAELRGRMIHDIIHCRSEDGTPMTAAECPSMKVLKTGARAFSKDDVFIHKDGTSFPVAFVSAPIVEEGAVIAVALSFRNITRRKRYESEREQLLRDYKEALANIKSLKGLMPICSSCMKIRDDQGYWKHIEAYIRENSEAEFSHGICPDCARKLYPQYYDKDLP